MNITRDKVLRGSYMCSILCNMISRHELYKNHPQQRKTEQWQKATMDNFIVTVILNEDFDPIKICEQIIGKKVYLWLIDGLQRSTTIAEFKSGKFKLGKKIFPYMIEYQDVVTDKNGDIVFDENGEAEVVDAVFDLRGKAYKDLPNKLKDQFDNCPIDYVKHLDCSDDEVGRHIARYNAGRPMTPAQKVVTFIPKFAKDIKKLSNHFFFRDCTDFTNAEIKGSKVERMIIDTMMFINCSDKYTKDVQKSGECVNNNCTKEMFDKLYGQLDKLYNVITQKTGKLFSIKNGLLWFKLFNEFDSLNLDPMWFGKFLTSFIDELHDVKVSGVSFDELDVKRSTKDKNTLTEKMNVLEGLMYDFLENNGCEIKISEVKDNNNETKDYEKNSEIIVENNIGEDANVSNGNNSNGLDKEFLAEFNDTQLMSFIKNDESKRNIASILYDFIGDKEDCIFYANCAYDWICELDDIGISTDSIANECIIPSIVMFISTLYNMDDDDKDDKYGIGIVKKFLEENPIVSDDSEENYNILMEYVA